MSLRNFPANLNSRRQMSLRNCPHYFDYFAWVYEYHFVARFCSHFANRVVAREIYLEVQDFRVVFSVSKFFPPWFSLVSSFHSFKSYPLASFLGSLKSSLSASHFLIAFACTRLLEWWCRVCEASQILYRALPVGPMMDYSISWNPEVYFGGSLGPWEESVFSRCLCPAVSFSRFRIGWSWLCLLSQEFRGLDELDCTCCWLFSLGLSRVSSSLSIEQAESAVGTWMRLSVSVPTSREPPKKVGLCLPRIKLREKWIESAEERAESNC